MLKLTQHCPYGDIVIRKGAHGITMTLTRRDGEELVCGFDWFNGRICAMVWDEPEDDPEATVVMKPVAQVELKDCQRCGNEKEISNSLFPTLCGELLCASCLARHDEDGCIGCQELTLKQIKD